MNPIFRKFNQLGYKFFEPLANMLYELTHNNYLILNASIKRSHANWGDDINPVLVKLLCPNKRIILRSESYNIKNKQTYLCIGSILSWMTEPNSVVWGSGVVYPEQKIIKKPSKVLAVRGPLSREYLINQGIDCPEVYGDPALLFPTLYQPKTIKKYKLGIIPHFRDKKLSLVKKLIQNKGAVLVDVENMSPWTKFIDTINECEYVITSSLHGMIISDAYGIPNLWVEFEGGESKRFAFRDYLLSVKKEEITEPVVIADNINMEDIEKAIQSWIKPSIDLSLLKDVCPFK